MAKHVTWFRPQDLDLARLQAATRLARRSVIRVKPEVMASVAAEVKIEFEDKRLRRDPARPAQRASPTLK